MSLSTSRLSGNLVIRPARSGEVDEETLMPHVITQNCCNDASCVAVCPVDCIHPTPEEPDYGTAEMLYIDNESCIDCGACIPACPVDAIVPDYDDVLPLGFDLFERLNSDYYAERAVPTVPVAAQPSEDTDDSITETLRVAIVGSGPAAWYTAEELLTHPSRTVEVDMFERLLTPGGLVRFGVAPDHQRTKSIQRRFERTSRREGFRLFLNVEIGRDLSHDTLTNNYHAVVYATGAMHDKPLGIPGESLPGSHSAAEFVAWYNGHPDFRNQQFDLSGRRAVIFGNGNVALDVARVLVRDPEALAQTDIADHALDALRESRIREVIVVGRRGPLEAGFTTPELIGLSEASGLQVSVSLQEMDDADVSAVDTDRRVLLEILSKLAVEDSLSDRHIALRFLQSPVELSGDGRVERAVLRRNELVRDGDRVIARGTDEIVDLPCDLVIRAVGYHGTPIPDVPFDTARGTIPHREGRVVDPVTDEPLPGVYTTGWIKRGPSGVIGTNKSCAHETVQRLLEDLRNDRLACRTDRPDIASLVPDSVGLAEFRAIDEHEVNAGKKNGRPRVKLVDPDEQLAVAQRRH